MDKRISNCFIGIILSLPIITYAMDLDNTRGLRYCEVIYAKEKFTFAVYNSLRLNDCPDDLWKKITVAQIKKQTGSYFVHLNGPRYTLMDGFRNVSLISKEQKVFGGIAMREAGILHLTLADIFRNKPYHDHKVNRHTTWLFRAGKPVYELVDPHGKIYVMQSYSVQIKPQNTNSLAKLADILKLPKGWRFKTGILLKDDTVVAVNDKAIVVQDELMNTYQLATHDLLI